VIRAAGKRTSAPGRAQREEYYRLKKVRIVELLEGKAARLAAIFVFIVIVLVLAFIMSQTA
jgi:hypothetical protein